MLASIPTGANFYVGFYDPTQSSEGWTTYLGPGTIASPAVSFSSVTQAQTLQANVTYVFALVSTAAILVPHTDAQTFSGGGTVAGAFGSNYPAAAHSAVITFTPASGAPVSTLVVLPSSCIGASSCSFSTSAPAGSNQGVQALLFASSDGSGPALALGTGTTTVFASQTTTFAFPLVGIMASFTLALTPATVTVGQAAQIATTEQALDASGEALASGFVGSDLKTPQFTVAISDATGMSTPQQYSGDGAGPISYTATTANGLTASASLAFAGATAATPDFGLMIGVGLGTCSFDEYVASGGSPIRTFSAPSAACTHLTFDSSGTLWVEKADNSGAYGIKSDGTSAGTLNLIGELLAFDSSGHAYLSDPATNAVDVYNGTMLVRQINTPGGPQSVGIDPAGNVYVAVTNTNTEVSSVIEYPSTGTGTLTPIASNSTVSAVAVDTTGTVYAIASATTIDVWSSGTFGAGSPSRTITMPVEARGLGVDASGAVFAASYAGYSPPAVYTGPSGSSSLTSLPGSYGSGVLGLTLATVP